MFARLETFLDKTHDTPDKSVNIDLDFRQPLISNIELFSPPKN